MNDPTEIRQWARDNGVAVSDRGKLRAVLAAVDEARATLPRTVRASIDVDPVQLL